MFFEELNPKSEQLHIVCVDFKIDHSRKNTKLTELKDTFCPYNLSNMSNVVYTSETVKTRTNIDVVYSSKAVDIKIITSALSDHYNDQIVFTDYVEKNVPLKNKVCRDWCVRMVFKIRDKLGRFIC